MEIDSSSPLYSLKDTKIKDLADEIDNLTVKQIMPNADYSSGIMKAIGDFKLSELDSKIDTITIGAMLDIDTEDPSTSPLMKFLAPYTLANLDTVEDNLTIGSVIEIDGTSPVLLQNIKDLHLTELETWLASATLGDVIDPGDDPLLQALADVQIDGAAMSAAIQNLELGTVLEINGSSPQILQSLEHTKIKDLSTAIQSLTIGELFDTSGNKLLTALSTSTLDSVGADIYNIEIGDMIDIDTTSPKILQAISGFTLGNIGTNINTLLLSDVIDTSGNIFLQALPADTTIGNVGEKMNQVLIEDVFGDEMYTGTPHTDANLKSSWKYLLRDEYGVIRHDYTIVDMPVLMDNMERNMQNATIAQLDSDGWIDIDDSLLSKYVITLGKTVGECTLSEFITAAASLLA